MGQYIHQKMRIEKTKTGKKGFWKIFTVARVMAKKLSTKTITDQSTTFWQLFGHNLGYSKDFSKCFFFWLSFFNTHLWCIFCHILRQKNFGSYTRDTKSIWLGLLQFWSKNYFSSISWLQTCNNNRKYVVPYEIQTFVKIGTP